MNTKTPEEILKSKESYNKDEWSEQPLFAMGDVIKAMKEYASQFTDASRREISEDEINEFVKKWMDSHEPDTFVKNKRGVYIYCAGHSYLNLTCFFNELLKEFIESTPFSQPQKEGWIPVTEKPEKN